MAKYLKLKRKIETAFRLLLTDPTIFKEIIVGRFLKKKVIKSSGLSQKLDDVQLEIQKQKLKNILVLSDRVFFSKIENEDWLWSSIRPEDESPSLVDIDLFHLDGVIVGGGDVKAAYIYLLKRLKRLNLVLPVFWVGDGFEFSGSTIPIIKEIECANIYLFNHYAELFSLKDPLLVKASFKDAKTEVERLFILGPNETLRVKIDDFLLNRNGDAVVTFTSTHPILTRGRHTRWRLWADIFYKNSFASSHGAHDYGESHINAGFFSGNGTENERVIITLPNYQNNLLSGEESVLVRNDQDIKKIGRLPEKILDRVEIDIAKDGNYGFRYLGKGESFLCFVTSPERNSSNIMFNHNSTQSMFEKKLTKLEGKDIQWVSKLVEQDFLIYPHAIPVLEKNHPLEFGFSFDGNNPPVKNFLVYLFDTQGKYLLNFSYTKNFIGNLYASELLGEVTCAENVGLIIISPDVLSVGWDPLDLSLTGNLVVINKNTLDRDFTEFQSCWRNIGYLVPQLPHWLHPMKGLIGTSNLVGRVLAGSGFRSGVVIVNASGNLKYDISAICTIKIFNIEGVELSKNIEILPFQVITIWFDELFQELDQFLSFGYGSCIITSADADLNTQIFSCSSSGSVALQHLWGY